MAMNREKIFEKLAGIKDLPSIPEVVGKVMNLIKDPEMSVTQISHFIEEDPVITAKVLQIANSPLFRGTNEITSLAFAASRLGLKEVEKIVLSISIMKGVKGMDRRETRLFWQHCISVALMTELVNKFSKTPLPGNDPMNNELFVGGLLHDIGLLVLKHHFADEYDQVMMVCEAGETNLYETELEMMGTSHAEIGAELARNWNIPEAVVAMIAWHHDPEKAPDAHLRLAQTVNVADFICNNQGLGFSGEVNIHKFSNTAWFSLGLKIEDVEEMLGEVKEKARQSELLSMIGT